MKPPAQVATMLVEAPAIGYNSAHGKHVHSFGGARRMTFAKTNPVVFRLGHMGDVVLTTGVLRRRNEKYGDRFTFVTRKPFAPLLENHPAVDEIIPLSPKDLAGFGSWLGKARALAEKFKGRPLLDLHGTLRSRILATVWKGPVRRYPKFSLARRLYAAGGFSFARNILLETNVPQRYAMALDKTPPDPTSLVPVITLTAEEKMDARKRMTELGLGPGTIALHPYAANIKKAWPRFRWDELITRLRSRDRDYLILGRDDSPLKPKDPRDLTGETDLRETCALLAQCAALVTGDSGPMHLAAAVGTPSVALFGPTDRAWGFYPTGPRDIVLENDMDCRPCSLHGKGTCERGIACLSDITPDRVLDALETSA